MSSARAHIAIVGGGYAGMSAAVELCRAGHQVSVFEAASTLGGRARRVLIDGRTLDNGLHILIGAYRQTLRMIESVSSSDFDSGLRRSALEFTAPGHFSMRTARLPAPMNLLAGLITARGLSAVDKFKVARMMIQLRLTRYRLQEDGTVNQLLRDMAQSESAIRLLWNPLCVAALNTQSEHASAQVFMNVLRDTFAAPASNSDLLLPITDFSRLFPERAAEFVRRHGGSVQTGIRVRAVRHRDDGARLALPTGGQTFSAAILAVAPQHLADIAGDEPALAPARECVEKFRYCPIYSVYLGYPASVRLPCPMSGLHAGMGQWVFDRGQLSGAPGTLGVVISAPGPHQAMPHDALATAIHDELKQTFGALPYPLWHQVIAEKRATFACEVGLSRPSPRTLASSIFLAGDYVHSEYPATLESAVLSGITAARLISET